MSELVLIANAGDGTISTLRLHREPAPRLELLATSDVGPGVGTFAIDAQRDLVYAAFKGDPAGIATMRLDRGDGQLTELSRRAVDSSLSYLCLGRGGSVLLGASYGGGFASTWPVDGGNPRGVGHLGDPVARVSFANAHCILAHAGHAYVVSLGEDLVAQFSVEADGRLQPLEPPTVAAPAGSGPRHLVIDGRNAYLMTEFSGEALRFEIEDDGGLVRKEAVPAYDPSASLSPSRFGADPVAEHLIWGADLHVAGPWLLCSERSASTIATLPIRDGRLGQAVAFAPTQPQPRGFAVTADGSYVVAVGELATSAALSRVQDDGHLAQLDQIPIGRAANWVRIVS
ncbi:MAG: beta-propeller fold lactonase family protein [Micrococcales bacterium]|nr:beta-propeller fold lactonase family protein [Micrococcales bacterium]